MSRTLLTRYIVALAALLTFSSNSFAQFNYPGGVAEFTIKKQNGQLPEVKYGIREPVILEQKDHWKILVGISLDTLPGEYLVYIKHALKDSTAFHKKIVVRQKNYPLHDAGSREGVAAAKKKVAEFSTINFSNTQQPSLPLQHPVPGEWADYFGHFTQNPRSNKITAQNFVTLTTTALSTVKAPQNAIVSRIDTDDKTFLSTIFLDHGRGLFSILSGVSDLTVEPGNGVVAGAVIGKLPVPVNSNVPLKITWQTVMNGAYVNPLVLTQLVTD